MNRADENVGGPTSPGVPTATLDRCLGLVAVAVTAATVAVLCLSPVADTRAAFTVRATTPAFEALAPSPTASPTPSPSPVPTTDPAPTFSVSPTPGDREPRDAGSRQRDPWGEPDRHSGHDGNSGWDDRSGHDGAEHHSHAPDRNGGHPDDDTDPTHPSTPTTPFP